MKALCRVSRQLTSTLTVQRVTLRWITLLGLKKAYMVNDNKAVFFFKRKTISFQYYFVND